MKFNNEILENKRKDLTKRIKLASGIPLEDKILNCTEIEIKGGYYNLTYVRKDGKNFSQGDCNRISGNGIYATKKNNEIFIKTKFED